MSLKLIVNIVKSVAESVVRTIKNVFTFIGQGLSSLFFSNRSYMSFNRRSNYPRQGRSMFIPGDNTMRHYYNEQPEFVMSGMPATRRSPSPRIPIPGAPAPSFVSAPNFGGSIGEPRRSNSHSRRSGTQVGGISLPLHR